MFFKACLGQLQDYWWMDFLDVVVFFLFASVGIVSKWFW